MKLENIAQSKKKNRQRLNWFRLAEHDRVPVNAQYSNPRVSFDGLNWFLTVGIECSEQPAAAINDVKDLAICSSGHVYKNINKTSRVRRLKKKQRRLQRKISRKYKKNKKGESYQKTRNIIKGEKQLLKINHRLTDIRTNHIHQATSEIVKREPSFTAERFYASSKLCSVCGHRKNDLKLSDRIYRCEHCGTVIDRDFNASVNLFNYGKSIIIH